MLRRTKTHGLVAESGEVTVKKYGIGVLYNSISILVSTLQYAYAPIRLVLRYLGFD